MITKEYILIWYQIWPGFWGYDLDWEWVWTDDRISYQYVTKTYEDDILIDTSVPMGNTAYDLSNLTASYYVSVDLTEKTMAEILEDVANFIDDPNLLMPENM